MLHCTSAQIIFPDIDYRFMINGLVVPPPRIGKRGPKVEAAHESEDRLFGEIGRLKMELDWLKKKSNL